MLMLVAYSHSVSRSAAPAGDVKLNKISSAITQNKTMGGSQAMLYAIGLTEDDMNKPQVGISPIWWEGKLALDFERLVLC